MTTESTTAPDYAVRKGDRLGFTVHDTGRPIEMTGTVIVVDDADEVWPWCVKCDDDLGTERWIGLANEPYNLTGGEARPLASNVVSLRAVKADREERDRLARLARIRVKAAARELIDRVRECTMAGHDTGLSLETTLALSLLEREVGR